MHSLMIRKGQSCQIQRLPSTDMLNLACKTKNRSTPDNLTKATQTTLVQAGGLDKFDKPVILTPIEVTILDTRQLLSMLGASKKSRSSYLSRILPQHQTVSLDIGQTPLTLDNLFRPHAGSKLGGLTYYPSSTKSTWQATWQTSAFHVSHGTRARTTDP